MPSTARARNVAVLRSVPGALKTSAVLSGLCGNIDKKKDENILDIAQFMLNQLCGLMQEDKETVFLFSGNSDSTRYQKLFQSYIRSLLLLRIFLKLLSPRVI